MEATDFRPLILDLGSDFSFLEGTHDSKAEIKFLSSGSELNALLSNRLHTCETAIQLNPPSSTCRAQKFQFGSHVNSKAICRLLLKYHILFYS